MVLMIETYGAAPMVADSLGYSYIIIGIAAGFLAGKIMRGGGFGVIINLILGIAGGVLGGWVFGLLGIAASGIIGSLITATVGAILMLWIASLFNKRNVD